MYSRNLPAIAVVGRRSIRSIFMPFPIACFTLTLFSDFAYWQTSNILWQHFSEWLLFAGLIGAALAVVAGVVDLFVGWLPMPAPALPLALGGAIVLILAILNSLVHAGDGWTAVVPYGLILSAVTVLAMVATDWVCRAMINRHDAEVRGHA